jgi:hypothetical protein
VAGRRAGAGLALAAIALSAAGCGLGGGGSTKTVTRTLTRTVTVTRTVTQPSTSAAACTGSQLAGTFNVVPGSPGGGQIAYTLTVRNASAVTCALIVRSVVLLDAADSPLPTKAYGALPSGLLTPSASASSIARFSPDVPGTGDNQSSACQPKAHMLRVTTTGGGSFDAPVKPATSVCEQGTLTFPSN